MNNRQALRAMPALHREAFPRFAPDLAGLDFAALAAWQDVCALQAQLAPIWRPDRYRWRRAATAAMQEYSNRLTAHHGPVPSRCDHCQSEPVSLHVAYSPKGAPRFAHFCDACGPTMPTGWMVVAFGPTSARARDE